MYNKLAVAIIFAVCFTAQAYVDGGLNGQKETRVCAKGQVTTYKAHVEFKAHDETESNTGEKHTKDISGSSEVSFEVSAVSADSNECKLQITAACSVADAEGKQCDTEGTLTAHATYFKEADDGETVDIHTMAEESAEASSLKIAIINVLSQKIEASSLDTDIEFSGHDIDGAYKAKQRMVKNGATVLLISTQVHSDTVEDDHSSDTDHGIAKKHSETHAEIDTATGSCNKVSKKAEVDSGSEADVDDDAIKEQQNPVGTPGVGELKVNGSIKVVKTGSHAVEPEEIKAGQTAFLQLQAGNKLRHHHPRARLNIPASVAEVAQHVEDARAAMAQPDFNVAMLRRSLNGQTAEQVIAAALGMTRAGKMPVANLISTLSACHRIRTPAAQQALLAVLVDDALPFSVREQALVSLTHADYERRPDAELVHGLARFAFGSDSSVLSARATMVLGNAIRGHADKALSARYVHALAGALHGSSAQRAMHLLGALANAGPSAAHLSASVAPFVVSADSGVRHQALLALQGMAPSAESSAAVRAASAYDLNAARHQGAETSDLETEIDALLDVETEARTGISVSIYSKSYRVSGTDSVNLSINGDISAAYADSTISLSGSGYFKTKVFKGGDKLTEGILTASKKSGEKAKITFTTKLLNVQIMVSTLWSQSSAAADAAELLEVSGGDVADFALGSAVTDLAINAESEVMGACPVDGNNIKIKDWNKEFFRLSYTYYGLLIPITLTAGLTGNVAINAVFAISTGCTYAGANTYGLVAGAAPSASISVFAHAYVTIFPFRAALEGSIVLLSGNLPLTGDMSTKHAHGFIKGTLSSVSGSLDAAFYMFECKGFFCSKGGYHKNLGRFNIVKWSGVSKTWTLYSSPTKTF